ncbi:MAG: hypothetical protein EOP09_20925, partial [Proteobacteria bacterium]
MSFTDLGLGTDLDTSRVKQLFARHRVVHFKNVTDLVDQAVLAFQKGEPIFWAQGRMEYGPRALGHRSIIARADSTELKDALNIRLKKRVWYQPFCPVMLDSDARELLEDYREPFPFMTCAFWVKKSERPSVIGTLNVDGSCRPQILADSDPSGYAELLRAWKKTHGRGVLLNTSLNVHGEPLASTVEDLKRAF